MRSHAVSLQYFVSIHASVKDATEVLFVDHSDIVVSIHASVKDATLSSPCLTSTWFSFNPRVREGRDVEPVDLDFIASGFNPRVREGRDKIQRSVCYRILVSIHASVKDATYGTCKNCEQYKVSIHASVKDATDGSSPHIAIIDVSIHASVKDATFSFCADLRHR